jgi:uncharacterized protein (TIGR02145 family)
MAENLNYSASGDGSKCYNNETANCDKYGKLYDWATATGAGVCPTGWHVPNNAEWDILIGYVQTENGKTYTPGLTADVAGTHLKATSGWNSSGNGADTYGFKALPGGYYGTNGFMNNGSNGIWWSSTENVSNAYRWSITAENSANRSGTYAKTNFYSVRCIQGN